MMRKEGRECLLRERPVPDLDRAIQTHKAAEITSAHNQVMLETTEVEAVFYTDKRNRRKKWTYLNTGQFKITEEIRNKNLGTSSIRRARMVW